MRGLLALAAAWRGSCQPSRNAHAPTLAPFLASAPTPQHAHTNRCSSRRWWPACPACPAPGRSCCRTARRVASALTCHLRAHALPSFLHLPTHADVCHPLCPRPAQRHRVIAAASADGAVPLQWGCAPRSARCSLLLRHPHPHPHACVLTRSLSPMRLITHRSETIKNLLMFSTTADSAIDETEASPFPPGCVFISSGTKTTQRARQHRLASIAHFCDALFAHFTLPPVVSSVRQWPTSCTT